jgi:hypothetical protein
MLIHSKFDGYVKNVRLYNAMGGIGEAALLGAAMGGGAAALTGGDPLKGALLGGLTGGAGAGIGGALGGATAGTEAALASQAGTAIGTGAPTLANAQGIAGLTSGAPTMANAAAANTAASTAASVPGGLGSGTFGMGMPMPGVDSFQSVIPQAGSPLAYTPPPIAAMPAAAPQTFTEGMQKFASDPMASLKANQFTAAGAGLAGAMGAANTDVYKEKEYNGPLKRFNPFDPNKYRASQYAEGGITSLASGGYDQQVGEDPQPMRMDMASGGIANLGSYSDGGRMLKGPGDGMSDSIPANISGKRPARLADGEFVVPADVVSHLGNGSTDAGAKTLYRMMDKVRTARTGRKAQGKQINPSKYMVA